MKEYLQTTRSPWFSFLGVLPLLVLYQVFAGLANLGGKGRVVNGADALIQNFLASLGITGWITASLIVAAVAGILCFRLDKDRNKSIKKEYFGLALGESSLYALLFGSLVAFLTSLVLPSHNAFLQTGSGGLTFGQKLATGLGAGLYEELVFRLILMGSLLWGFRKLQWKEAPAIATAVLVSSFLFSLFHYVGTYADAFELTSFTFRFVAGVILAGLFAWRGFAVAAWTHSLYDVFLLLSGHG